MSGRVEVVIFWFAMLSLQSSGHGQELQDPPKQSPSNSIASTVGGDILHVLSSPFRLSRDSSLKLLALTVATTGFMTLLDDRIDKNFIKRDDFYVKPAIGLAKIGDGYDVISSNFVLAGLSVSMLAGGLILDDKKLLETTRLVVESFLIAGAITQLGKRVLGRSRPYTGAGPTEFEPLKFRSTTDSRSFPSGHTTSAFAMMTVLAKQYDHLWINDPGLYDRGISRHAAHRKPQSLGRGHRCRGCHRLLGRKCAREQVQAAIKELVCKSLHFRKSRWSYCWILICSLLMISRCRFFWSFQPLKNMIPQVSLDHAAHLTNLCAQNGILKLC